MNKFQLELERNGKTEIITSGSRLDLIMKARLDGDKIDHAVLKDDRGKIIWQAHNKQ